MQASWNRGRKGFSLVEVLAAAVLVGVGVAALFGALSSLSQAQGRMQEREVMVRLADSKLAELAATRTYLVEPEGGFENPEEQDYRWTAETEPTGTENLDLLRVRVSRTDRDGETISETLVFTAPAVQETEE
ncbi:MAG: prepilin-type N-terminal cleavage/methylation domain-containing protein [Fimbriimonadaceae bacterium]|nr:prepilin-type N-terminal cleavage/methylation domain-containing protein [Fimbriimonadaceae bacterium]